MKRIRVTARSLYKSQGVEAPKLKFCRSAKTCIAGGLRSIQPVTLIDKSLITMKRKSIISGIHMAYRSGHKIIEVTSRLDSTKSIQHPCKFMGKLTLLTEKNYRYWRRQKKWKNRCWCTDKVDGTFRFTAYRGDCLWSLKMSIHSRP